MEAASLQQRMKRVVERFRQSRISSALAGWKDFLSLRRRYRRFAKKLFQHKLLAVFNTWYEWTENTVKNRKIGQKVVKRMLQRKLAGCFNTWVSNIREEIRLRNVCTRVVKKMLLRQLAGCFSTWYNSVEECKRLRNLCQRVIKRMLLRQLAGCFESWVNCIKETKRLRLVLKRVSARWQKGNLVQKINQWKNYVEKRLDDKFIVKNWLNAVENREIASALRTWKLFVEHVKLQEQHSLSVNHEHDRLLHEYFIRKRRRLMFRCVSQWRRIIVRTKFKRGKNGKFSNRSSGSSVLKIDEPATLDTLVDLICQLVVQKRFAQHQKEKRVAKRMDSPLERKERPNTSPFLRQKHTESFTPTFQPWISGNSTSPSHSTVVASHQKFMKPYQFQYKMYDGHESEKVLRNVDRRSSGRRSGSERLPSKLPHKSTHRSTHKSTHSHPSRESSRSEILKNEVERFLTAITGSFLGGKGRKSSGTIMTLEEKRAKRR
jgi:uncharacterized protein involved in tolerance to divalent cations